MTYEVKHAWCVICKEEFTQTVHVNEFPLLYCQTCGRHWQPVKDQTLVDKWVDEAWERNR